MKMSILHASTANRIGVRRSYKPVTAMGVYRAPAETGPRQALFPTRPMPGLAAIPAEYFGSPAAILSPARAPLLQSGSNPGVQATPVFEHTKPIIFSSGGGGTAYSPAIPTTTTPIHTTPATASPASPQSYTDSYGNVWELGASGWVMVKPGAASQASVTPTTAATTAPATTQPALTSGAASTEQAGTPVPVNWPTNQAYTDSNGYIWTYTASGGWQVTGTAAGSGAASTIAASQASMTPAGTNVSISSGFDISSLTSWLQQATILSPIPNFFVVAGGGLLALMIFKGKR